jgi:hypothetical protein
MVKYMEAVFACQGSFVSTKRRGWRCGWETEAALILMGAPGVMRTHGLGDAPKVVGFDGDPRTFYLFLDKGSIERIYHEI